jgi:translation initiation factor 2B subunit (eIF-2B alpha/beta/delta family)
MNTGISQTELQKKYSIGGNNCINYWMRKFGSREITVEQLNLQQAMSKEEAKTPRERKLETKVKELEKALEQERLRTLALDTMINIAERDLKISIRKKSGTKQ